MPGQTSHGYPYAEPDDHLTDWPTTSKALADKLDDQPRLRSLPTAVVHTDSQGDVVIALSPPLDRPPTAVVLTSSGPRGHVQPILFVVYQALCTASELQFGVWQADGSRFVGELGVSGIVSY
jgi:hypothetical protein